METRARRGSASSGQNSPTNQHAAYRTSAAKQVIILEIRIRNYPIEAKNVMIFSRLSTFSIRSCTLESGSDDAKKKSRIFPCGQIYHSLNSSEANLNISVCDRYIVQARRPKYMSRDIYIILHHGSGDQWPDYPGPDNKYFTGPTLIIYKASFT